MDNCIIMIFILIFLVIYLYSKLNKQKNNNKNSIIETLIRQCSRWAVAAIQDKSPMISVLHANYAAGYLWALKDIASDIEIKQATNINIIKFTKKITTVQDLCTKRVSANCPQFLEHIDKELARLGGDL